MLYNKEHLNEHIATNLNPYKLTNYDEKKNSSCFCTTIYMIFLTLQPDKRTLKRKVDQGTSSDSIVLIMILVAQVQLVDQVLIMKRLETLKRQITLETQKV